MAEFRSVAKPGDIEEGELSVFDVDGMKVAIANVEGTFFAFGDECTHEKCSLAEGDLDGTTVTCPCHGSQFDVTSGEVLNPPATEPVPVFRARVEGDAIEIQI
jgi:nitrite reductase/ring-hydroxylating ferredoxin subunit